MPHPATSHPSARAGTPDWSATFLAAADQVSLARRELAAFLHGSDLADDALICLSELVTNAIQHSRCARPGGRLTVAATLAFGRLRVEVHDEGGTWQPSAHRDGLRGRGLTIVAALAHWGITSNDDGTRTVWFELPAIAPHAGPSRG
jgi:anti-sigma regulatory factor (Ser/Thr protein kinase)